MPETGTTRRRTAPTKGDQGERAILDAAEAQLDTLGFDRMTIETITKAVGITRGAFYSYFFYFASKNAVLAALVERTETTLRTEIQAADASGVPTLGLRRSIDQTRDMWRDHGNVMRAAIELTLWSRPSARAGIRPSPPSATSPRPSPITPDSLLTTARPVRMPSRPRSCG